MKFNNLIVAVFIVIGSNGYCAIIFSPDAVQPEMAKGHGVYFNGKTMYLYEGTGRILRIGSSGQGLYLEKLHSKKNQTQDLSFGNGGPVLVPTKAKLKGLELRIRSDNESIFIIDKQKGDIIVFDKDGKLKGTIKGKDKDGNIDSNLTVHQPFPANLSAASALSSEPVSSSAPVSSGSRNLQREFDEVGSPPPIVVVGDYHAADPEAVSALMNLAGRSSGPIYYEVDPGLAGSGVNEPD
jgi:hypothetical protein